jgi:hypothetical protein
MASNTPMKNQRYCSLILSILGLAAIVPVSSGCKKGEGGSEAAADASVTAVTGAVAAAPAAAGSQPFSRCVKAKFGTCAEIFTPSPTLGEQGVERLCTQSGGAYQKGAACRVDETLWGTCTTRTDDKSAISSKTFFYDEGENKGSGPAKTKKSCDILKGEWAPGAASNAAAGKK